MSEERTVKKVRKNTSEGNGTDRNRIRRWLDDVENDVKKKGTRG